MKALGGFGELWEAQVVSWIFVEALKKQTTRSVEDIMFISLLKFLLKTSENIKKQTLKSTEDSLSIFLLRNRLKAYGNRPGHLIKAEGKRRKQTLISIGDSFYIFLAKYVLSLRKWTRRFIVNLSLIFLLRFPSKAEGIEPEIHRGIICYSHG